MNTPTETQVFVAVNATVQKIEKDEFERADLFNKLFKLYSPLPRPYVPMSCFTQMYEKSGATSLEEFQKTIELQLTFQ